MIKSKPDIKSFTNDPKDPNDFLEGGEADKAAKSVQPNDRTASQEAAAQVVEAFKPEPTVQKLFRLRWDIANALKIGAAQESARTGKRVTETDIVQQLLKKHYSIK